MVVGAPVSRQEQTKHAQIGQREELIIQLGRVLLITLLVLSWQLLSGSVLDPLLFSSPAAVVSQIVTWVRDGTLWMHSIITIQETVAGLLIGVASGIIFGFLIGPQRIVRKIMDPILLAANSVPKVALAPLFIVWLGIGIEMKIVLAAVTVFFLVFFNTVEGVRNVDQDLVNAVRLMGGDRKAVLLKVVLPSAMGWILTGVRVAIPYALIGAVIGELVASNRGIGYLVIASASQYNTAGVFASLFVLTLLVLALNSLVDVVESRTEKWKTDYVSRVSPRE